MRRYVLEGKTEAGTNASTDLYKALWNPKTEANDDSAYRSEMTLCLTSTPGGSYSVSFSAKRKDTHEMSSVLKQTIYPSLALGHPHVLSTEVSIVGLDLRVYGLEEIKDSKLPIAAVVGVDSICRYRI